MATNLTNLDGTLRATNSCIDGCLIWMDYYAKHVVILKKLLEQNSPLFTVDGLKIALKNAVKSRDDAKNMIFQIIKTRESYVNS